ncbi:hypothetical protein MAR_015761 [Mya arenaria]|uniref:Uncharacterized protein n=1 Tax=Mya arenaria TaxID=6604 RepID=A0ABY7FI30_MYAAR|nr:hypothetical protein MAR_015761 [Mya arenaria]
MLKECEEDYNVSCTDIMCTHFVLKVVFLQQCHGECKNLATAALPTGKAAPTVMRVTDTQTKQAAGTGLGETSAGVEVLVWT